MKIDFYKEEDRTRVVVDGNHYYDIFIGEILGRFCLYSILDHYEDGAVNIDGFSVDVIVDDITKMPIRSLITTIRMYIGKPK